MTNSDSSIQKAMLRSVEYCNCISYSKHGGTNLSTSSFSVESNGKLKAGLVLDDKSHAPSRLDVSDFTEKCPMFLRFAVSFGHAAWDNVIIVGFPIPGQSIDAFEVGKTHDVAHSHSGSEQRWDKRGADTLSFKLRYDLVNSIKTSDWGFQDRVLIFEVLLEVVDLLDELVVEVTLSRRQRAKTTATVKDESVLEFLLSLLIDFRVAQVGDGDFLSLLDVFNSMDGDLSQTLIPPEYGTVLFIWTGTKSVGFSDAYFFSAFRLGEFLDYALTQEIRAKTLTGDFDEWGFSDDAGSFGDLGGRDEAFAFWGDVANDEEVVVCHDGTRILR
ncbi:hypothetical protein HG531_006821 [Fusarium graminearum]|nr:hypothetical protein HG531_006821 [Fusarium graminearum]